MAETSPEVRLGPGATSTRFYRMADGPLRSYARTVTVLGPAGSSGSGSVTVAQVVTFRIGLPGVGWLFAWPLRGALGQLGTLPASAWWAPPQRLGRRAAVTLLTLCALSATVGYLDDLLPATMTYAAAQFRVGTAGQGLALGLVELSALVTLALLAMGDRLGRRRLILVTTALGTLVSATGALSGSLGVLTATQIVAGGLLGAGDVLLGILLVEEMPAGSRAWALALATMSFGLGGGVALAALPLAGTGPGGWRWLYVLGLGVLPAVVACRPHLPESDRWRRARSEARPRPRWTAAQRRRLAILGAGALLLAVFDAPAGGFQNQYLRAQRHFSPLRISLVEQITGTVGGVGTLLGGRLADTRGRRPVAAVAVGAGALATLAVYFSAGTALDGWLTASSVLGYAAVPALGVYGAELFPTALRGSAGGLLTVAAAVGGLAGLGASGLLAGAIGTLGPALAVVAIGPALLVALIVLAYPETAGRSLEEINPADAEG